MFLFPNLANYADTYWLALADSVITWVLCVPGSFALTFLNEKEAGSSPVEQKSGTLNWMILISNTIILIQCFCYAFEVNFGCIKIFVYEMLKFIKAGIQKH